MFASAAFRGTSGHGIYGDAVHEVDWSVGKSREEEKIPQKRQKKKRFFCAALMFLNSTI